ncbi:hypothetical protein ACU6VI_20300 (plasmid) [Sphaerotilus natans]|uniref:hypothetical protein n=1 Tax=Sphaerotilus natans TaxID=34103 RepID=UPI00406BFFF6
MNEPARNKFDRHPEPLKRICGGGGEFSARASPAGPLGNLAAGRCRSAKKKTAIAAEKCGFHESLQNQGSQSDRIPRRPGIPRHVSIPSKSGKPVRQAINKVQSDLSSQSLRNQGSQSDSGAT